MKLGCTLIAQLETKIDVQCNKSLYQNHHFTVCFPSGVWGGAKLADVLELVGIPKLTSVTQFGGKHVEFVSIDRCKVIDMACVYQRS